MKFLLQVEKWGGVGKAVSKSQGEPGMWCASPSLGSQLWLFRGAQTLNSATP